MLPNDFNDALLTRQNTTEMQYQLAFHNLLVSVFSRFHSSQYGQLDKAIEQTLQEIGTFVQADRSYLFLFSEDNLFMSNTHEWFAEGIPAQKDNLQNLSTTDYSWFINELLSSDYLYIPSVEKMSGAALMEQTILASQQIKSLLAVPLKRQNTMYGFLGFDAVTQPREWSVEEINLLTIIANILFWAKNSKQTANHIRIALQLANSIEEGIYIITEPDQISWVNKAFNQITGYSYEDIIGQPHFLVDLVEMDQAAVKNMHQLLREQGRWSGIVTGKHKDGHTYPASFFISTNQEKDENLVRYLIIIKDISEYYELEQERAKLQKQTITAQKLNSLSAMSAGVVHEIAQPLNSIKVMVDGMLYCYQNNFELPRSEIFQKLGEVSTEIKRIDEIIQSIRSFAGSSQSTELSPCSWNEAVERALGLLGRQMATHQIIVRPVLAADLPLMYANPLRLDEVLVNLLVNAMHALDLCDKKEKEIICTTSYTDKHTILEITDNACGIDESLYEMIFEPFFTDKHSPNGMGLGLSVVASIMTSLQGQVVVSNNDKGGATFRLELPIYKKMINNEMD